MNTEQLVKKMSVLGKVEIHYSTLTDKFYLSIHGVEVKNDIGMLSGITEHRETIEGAVKAFYEVLTSSYIVKNAYREDRKEYMFLDNWFVCLDGQKV